jgi:hypothetical protein
MFGIYYEKEFYFNNYATDVTTNVFILLLVVCAWLGNVDSLVNRDLQIHHFEKIVSRGVNKIVMEHLAKIYKVHVGL